MSNLNFENMELNEQILKSLEKLGYIKPSKVQEKVIPIALKNRDIIVKSKTGSGKTASFAIPICEKVQIEENKPQALILTPTRELCVQVKEDIQDIGKFKKVRAAAIFGKQPFSMQVKELKQRVHIVVGTPGRTLDHIKRNSLDVSEIKYLIIDEADEMLNMGFIDQVEDIIKKIPTNRVTMLFSATISKEVEQLCGKYMKNTCNIEVNPQEITENNIEQTYYKVNFKDKVYLLNNLITIENPDSCIIFCNTKKTVDELVKEFNHKKYPCVGLHGGMMQKDRLEIMKRFKKGEFIYLIATDLAARGIDIENITHVINYDIPLEKESYVHRTGRTGRAGREGKAITFVTPYEDKFLSDIEEYIGFKILKSDEIDKNKIEESKKAFENKIKSAPKLKKDKNYELNKEITKIYINVGKKKKIRPGDIVGAITKIPGITVDDIGIIDVQDNISYFDILNKKGKSVLQGLKTMTIKGKKVRAEKALK